MTFWYLTIEINEVALFEDRLVSETELRHWGFETDPLLFEAAFFLDPVENTVNCPWRGMAMIYHR